MYRHENWFSLSCAPQEDISPSEDIFQICYYKLIANNYWIISN